MTKSKKEVGDVMGNSAKGQALAKRRGTLVPLVLTFCFLFFSWFGDGTLWSGSKAYAAIQATYYVSPSGSDANNGTSLSTPFATIQKARDVVRANKGSMTGDIVVYIRGGNYYQNATITFDENDSANNGFKIIYKNYASEVPVFHGGQRITGWTLDSGNIYKANVGTGWTFETLTENNVRAFKARTPNVGSYLQAEGPGGSAQTQFIYKSGDLPSFTATYAQAVIWSGTQFVQSTAPISSVNTGSRTITLQNVVAYDIEAGNRYYVQGAKAFLDAPGEFYLDEAAGYLYYYPRSTPIANQTIVAPKTTRLLQVKGSSMSAKVSGLQFEGLTFNLSDFTKYYPWDTVNNVTDYKQGMVYLENATNITLKFNQFLNAGYNGIELSNYAQSNTIYGNYVNASGSSAIRLASYDFGQYGPEGDFANAAAAYINKYNTVSNNLVENGGQFVGHAPGISVTYSGDNEISYNNVRHFPYIGINVSGEAYYGMNFGSTIYGQTLTYANRLDFVYAKNNQIKFNDVSDVMREAQDGGMIYTWGTGRGNVIDNNVLHDTAGSVPNGNVVGIYLDCSSVNVTIRNNLIHHNRNAANTGEDGFYDFLLKGPDHIVTNNIAADNLVYKEAAVTNDAPLCESTHNMTFTNNILYRTGGSDIYSFYASQPGDDHGLGMATVDNNVFYHPGGTYEVNGIPGDDTFANWKTLDNGKYDQHSVLADPLFVNPNAYNYTVSAGSPALALGFVNIDTSAVGLKGDYPFSYSPTPTSTPTPTPTPSPTPTVTLYPVADSYVNSFDATSSGTNYNSDIRLVVSSKRVAYLKFDLSGYSNTGSAKLRVRGFTNTGVSSTVSAYGVNSDTWTEGGITANNAPSPSPTPASSATVTSTDQFYEFPVTSFVQSQLSGDHVASFALKNLPGGEYVGFFAKEAGTEYVPELVLVEPVAASPTPAPVFANKIVSGVAGIGTAEISASAGDYTISPTFATDYTAYFNGKFAAQPTPLPVVTPSGVSSGNVTTSTATEHPVKKVTGTNTITNTSGYMSIGSPADIGATAVYGGTSCSIGPTTNLVINGDVVCNGPLTFNGSIDGLVIHGNVIAAGDILFNAGAGSFTVDGIMSSQGSIAFEGTGITSGLIKGDLIGNGISCSAKLASSLTINGYVSSTGDLQLSNWNNPSVLTIKKSVFVTGNSQFYVLDKATIQGDFYAKGNVTFNSTVSGNGLTVGKSLLSKGTVTVHGVSGTFSVGGFLGALTQLNFDTNLTHNVDAGGISTGKVNITNNSSPANIIITYNPPAG